MGKYSEIILKAHILLCPVNEKTSFYWVTETYGKTKMSGAENDCIFNGKIGIFPESYPKMNWFNYFYNSKESLVELLENLSVEKLNSDYSKLEPYYKYYNFENVKNNLESQLLSFANE